MPSPPSAQLFRRATRLVGETVARWLRRQNKIPAQESDRTLLDIFDADKVARFIAKQDPTVLAWSREQAETGPAGAARMVLGLLREDEGLRQKFPKALTEGLDGAFFHWLMKEGQKRFNFSTSALEHLRAAFSSHPEGKVLRVYLQLPSLHKTQPLAFTPLGGRNFIKWLLRQGRQKHQFQDEEILWFLRQASENPWSLLAIQYLIQPGWQAQFPCALTAPGLREWMEWLQQEHHLKGLTLPDGPLMLHPADELQLLYQHRPCLRKLLPVPYEAEQLAQIVEDKVPSSLRKRWQAGLREDLANGLADKPGVNVIGHFSYRSGLQQAAVTITEALQAGGYRVSQRDLPAGLRSDTLDRSKHLGLEVFDVTLSVVAPFDPLEKRYQQSGLAMRPDVHRVGVWYWELDQLPQAWIERAASMQEIWAPSRFIANAMRPVMPVPVFEMPPGVVPPRPTSQPRSVFGLKDDQFVFLFMFDMCSVMERKNPLGLIRAFKLAFGDCPGVCLVIKVLRGSAFPEDFQRLQTVAAENGVKLIDEALSQDEAHGLLNNCDAYVSLHRSEGFGLTMAEAMLLGKPVVATGYSGNMDFMNSSNSLLVDYELVPITSDLQFYSKGNHWAEPSIEDAASKMRWLYEHQGEARALGQRARNETSEALSLEAASRRMSARIEQIRSSKSAGIGSPTMQEDVK